MRRLKTPLILMAVIALIGSIVSFQWVSSVAPIYLADIPQEEVDKVLGRMSMAAGLSVEQEDINFGFIFGHNIRAVLVMFIVGLFSLGVLGELVFAINVGVVGGVLAVLGAMGLPAWTLFLGGVLPHGIFEIPAIIFAGASILYFGALLVTPNPTRTMGEVVISVAADWLKIFVGVIVPLLALAALIEVNITPHILATIVR